MLAQFNMSKLELSNFAFAEVNYAQYQASFAKAKQLDKFGLLEKYNNDLLAKLMLTIDRLMPESQIALIQIEPNTAKGNFHNKFNLSHVLLLQEDVSYLASEILRNDLSLKYYDGFKANKFTGRLIAELKKQEVSLDLLKTALDKKSIVGAWAQTADDKLVAETEAFEKLNDYANKMSAKGYLPVIFSMYLIGDTNDIDKRSLTVPGLHVHLYSESSLKLKFENNIALGQTIDLDNKHKMSWELQQQKMLENVMNIDMSSTNAKIIWDPIDEFSAVLLYLYK
ncbi:MAG: hypothetical protein WC758_00375 [Candidatus Woesearchaeota archaeon]|jgi:hypothetical protein